MRLNILAFAIGVLSLQMQPELSVGIVWGMFGLVLALPAWRWQNWPARLLAVTGCFALGFAWAGWRADIRLADHLDAGWEGRDVEVIGVIAGLPQDFSNGTRFEFDVNTVLTAGALIPQKIMLSWYQGRRDEEQFERMPVRPGEQWRMTVRLKRPHGNANPGGFDYEAWLLERNIRASGYVRPNPAQRQVEMVWQADYAIERLRYSIRSSFSRMLPEASYPWAGVLVALVIGDQRAINGGA
ncbi:MAG: ComEC/Rec2-related protein:DNA internalization-related competence protein ComEC/Rec2 [Proteobacteria bacterium]|nr:ComEC/Rec2-related protein:DNA internalization-related competence protein ComEC/Rec2 [Pseudomonadota bacterium]